MKLIAIFSLILLCGAPSFAQDVIDGDREDTQFWNETQIIVPMRDRADLMFLELELRPRQSTITGESEEE